MLALIYYVPHLYVTSQIFSQKKNQYILTTSTAENENFGHRAQMKKMKSGITEHTTNSATVSPDVLRMAIAGSSVI